MVRIEPDRFYVCVQFGENATWWDLNGKGRKESWGPWQLLEFRLAQRDESLLPFIEMKSTRRGATM